MLEFSVGRIVSNGKSFSDFQREKSPELGKRQTLPRLVAEALVYENYLRNM